MDSPTGITVPLNRDLEAERGGRGTQKVELTELRRRSPRLRISTRRRSIS